MTFIETNTRALVDCGRHTFAARSFLAYSNRIKILTFQSNMKFSKIYVLKCFSYLINIFRAFLCEQYLFLKRSLIDIWVPVYEEVIFGRDESPLMSHPLPYWASYTDANHNYGKNLLLITSYKCYVNLQTLFVCAVNRTLHHLCRCVIHKYYQSIDFDSLF